VSVDQAPAEPLPLLAGTFAVYEDGRGGYVLVIDTPATGVERRHIPGKMVRVAAKFLGGNPLGRLGGNGMD
jgi:hypothetical protein